MAIIHEFDGEVIEWRGPAPFLFVCVPEEISDEIKALSKELTYGWGCIPVTAQIGSTVYTTSLFPKDGRYLVPVKALVQNAEKVGLGDTVRVLLTVVGTIG